MKDLLNHKLIDIVVGVHTTGFIFEVDGKLTGFKCETKTIREVDFEKVE